LNPNDMQHGGKHYRAGYQHWDLVADLQMNYYLANATKYLTRHGKKNGREDVLKAEHYVRKYLDLVRGGRMPKPYSPPHLTQLAQQELVLRFLDDNGLLPGSSDYTATYALCLAYGVRDVEDALAPIRELLEEYDDGAEPTPAYVDQGRD
jgi:hypothetical protein